MYKIKVLVIGPCESGKTALSNFLAEATDTSEGQYHPTQGVRILEFEGTSMNTNSRHSEIEVELWDCSGDRKFESCWPAIAKDTGGIVFVYNPDEPNHDKQLDYWYNYFIDQQTIKDTQCMVMAHHRSGVGAQERSVLSSSFSNMPCIHSNIEENGEMVRDEFNRFLTQLLTAMSHKRDQEELSIMNSK
ncbi:hypothetical protein ScPMuIL_006291 [Solemya velum]